ncbi:MAG: lysylphosphatidylglycerol synthase transmembrane domain-containing protein [Candidatus Gracilibacteria bacterium]|nr:lysylphosphatidylglycerol synthase transmembrane domain-containing protein [Candidatus Gracilibacteria bacterium]
MIYKKLIIVFILGLAVTGYFLHKFLISIEGNFALSLLRLNLWIGLLAILLHLAGHLIRSYKSGILINPIRKSTQTLLFKSLSIGFLFNTILPFRIGELIRAHLIGKNLFISRTVVFITILFERAVDGLILCLLSIAFIATSNSQLGIILGGILYQLIAFVFLASVLVFTLILLLYSQNKFLIGFIRKLSGIFNQKLRHKIRFISWSAIYGTNLVFKKSKMLRYLMLSVLMWGFYLGAIFLLLQITMPSFGYLKNALASVASYLSVSLPSGPAYLGSYHYFFSSIAGQLLPNSQDLFLISLLSWAVMVLPISLIGLFFLFYNKQDKRSRILNFFGTAKQTDTQKDQDPLHKLFRQSDVSAELENFLDAYFNHTEITHELNKLEMAGKVRLIKTFKGGSNAITALIWNGEKKCIRKFVLSQYEDKLKAQYDWIKQREEHPFLPKIIRETKDINTYSIDLEYQEEFIPFFDYVHSSSNKQNCKILEKVFRFVSEHIHTGDETAQVPADLAYYIESKIQNKLQDTIVINNDLRKLVTYPELLINGSSYRNYHEIIKLITQDTEIMQALSTCKKSHLHGDLTIDNIVVSGDNFILLDPNNENYISDPIVDYAKLFQSLHSGYEFLCNLVKVDVKENRVQFEENISSKYTELFAYLQDLLRKELSPERLKLVKFHEAVHFFRMLTYRARINPQTLPVFYAIGIRLLNEFYDEFKSST